MRILFTHDGPLQVNDRGRYFSNWLTNDAIKRYFVIASEVDIATRVENTENFLGLSQIESNNINVHQISNLSSVKGILLEKRKAKKKLLELIGKSDALVIRLPSIIGTMSLNIARKNNKPYLIEMVGCPWDAFWNHSWKGKLLAPFMLYTTKKAVKNAPYVVYVTNEFLQKRYPTNSKNTNCSNVALTEFDDKVLDKRLEKIESKSDNDKIIIGTTAAVNVRYKGQQYIIKALGRFKKQGITNYEYQLVGGGDQTYLKSVAEKEGVVEQVIFLGSMPHNKVFEWLEIIDIYVQPSKTEGLPRALIEAMSKGCPCIGSNAGGIPELLDSAFIFRKGNVKDLASILTSLDTEQLVKQAKRNFEISKGYIKEVIETRRNKFLCDFAESVKKND